MSHSPLFIRDASYIDFDKSEYFVRDGMYNQKSLWNVL